MNVSSGNCHVSTMAECHVELERSKNGLSENELLQLALQPPLLFIGEKQLRGGCDQTSHPRQFKIEGEGEHREWITCVTALFALGR